MPDYLKKLFTINDKIVTYRYVDGLYQARFRRDGYNIEVASKSFDTMRQKFLDKLLETQKAKQNAGYSFITRAKECGCNPELVMKWVGHEFDADVKTSRVDRGYTTYSQEYILQEINKIEYKL